MTTDLLSRAHRLEKLAKAARDNEGDKQTIERTKTALDKLSMAIQELDTQLKTRRALDRLGMPRREIPDLSGPLDELRDFVVSRGRPSPQKLQGATNRVSQQVALIERESVSRWELWTSGELEKLPVHKVAALSTEERQRVQTSLRELALLSKRAPNEAVASTFGHHLRRVQEDLRQVSLGGPILDVLERFASPSGVSLAELSDDEISALRSVPEIAVQFIVRRQM